MTRFKCLGGWACVVAFTSVMAGECAAQQTPKQMVEIATTMADQCAGLKLVCRAATMDKKYQKNCEDFKVSLNQSSNRNLATGYDKLDAKNYPSALRYAGQVCDYDPELATKRRDLMDAIRKAQDPTVAAVTTPPPPVAQPVAPKDEVSPVKAAEAERAFANGDFDAAAAAARQVTDRSLQGRAEAVQQKIASYTAAMQEARQKEGGDPQGALQSYRSAFSISPRGPGDPGSHISSLEAHLRTPVPQPAAPVIVAGNHPPPPPPQPGVKPVPVDPGIEANRLINEAKQAEGRNLQEALRLLQNAQRVQPGNAVAIGEQARIQGLINSDPKEQAKVLADAIRAFYGLNYAEAEDDLTSYLSSTTAKYRGAAYFYLGASRLYREILDSSGRKVHEAASSAQVQRPFKDARTACYRPLDKYLSPVVLSAWNASSGSATCAR